MEIKPKEDEEEEFFNKVTPCEYSMKFLPLF